MKARLDRTTRRAPIAARRIAVVARFRRRDHAVATASRRRVVDRLGARADLAIDHGGVARHRACAVGLRLREGREELLLGPVQTARIDGAAGEDAFARQLEIAAKRFPVALIFAATHLSAASGPAEATDAWSARSENSTETIVMLCMGPFILLLVINASVDHDARKDVADLRCTDRSPRDTSRQPDVENAVRRDI